jgi:hypothetical protein
VERHELDSVSLVAGIVFALLGLAFLLHEVAGTTLELRWVWPALLIGLGVALLLDSRPARRP